MRAQLVTQYFSDSSRTPYWQQYQCITFGGPITPFPHRDDGR